MDAVLRRLGGQLPSGDRVESFVYRESRFSPKGIAYRYLAHYATMDAIVTITLDRQGKIADLDVSPQ